MNKKYLTRLSLLLFVLIFVASAAVWEKPEPFKILGAEAWADSVLNTMSEEQALGQLFMVATYSNKPESHALEIEALIKNNGIGGVIFFQGGPVRQAQLTNRYQELSRVPLFIAMDAEWGLGMRLDSTMNFPKQMTLGAIQDNTSIYKMGVEIGKQCNRLGVHINFAPVVDINSNANNPVIGVRSFGEDKFNVSAKAIAYMKGMQSVHVLANAKHFPGHGDTDTDSHLALPIINKSAKDLNEMELYPFKQMIDSGVTSIMVAHIHVPSLDDATNKPSTLSKPIVTDLLKNELGFRGLLFTDALNMKGVSSQYKPGEVDVRALLAGNDVLLYAENVPLAIKKITKAINDKDISREEVQARVKKILMAKYWAGLNQRKKIETETLYQDLNNPSAQALLNNLYQQSITVVKNANNVIPIKFPDTTSLASVSISYNGAENIFQKTLSAYAPFDHYSIDKAISDTAMNQLIDKLQRYETVVVSVHQINSYNTKTYGVSASTKAFIEKIQASHPRVIITVFGVPYSLKYFSQATNLICGYEDNVYTQKLVPQLLFGVVQSSGKLPVTATTEFKLNSGINISTNNLRLRYDYPENLRMDSKTLAKIDTIVNLAIKEGAMPGCQILVAKSGAVIYNKSFGYYTYDKTTPVTQTTLYDIASISKVAGTLQAIMFLEERGLIKLNYKISIYLPDLIGTNKEDLVISDILTHQAGLQPYLPHWRRTMDSSGFSPKYYRTVQSDSFPNMVSQNLYSIAGMEDSLWKWTKESALMAHPKIRKKVLPYNYVYSDLGFYIMKRLAESLLDQPLEDFLKQNFYDPMCLQNFYYNPLQQNISIDRITPTEQDKYFRKCLVRGTVHDPGAALLGGVGGHAGIFANATDLATLMQMNLQLGYYGDYRFLLPETIKMFSRTQSSRNRRGLGWDKPQASSGGPCSYLVSSATYGHTGFTGTAAWVDPEQGLVYIFLSNRVYPDANNNRLIRDGIRTQIQTVIYKSILNFKD
ncbi:glycoside hydrolase family 3 N-terminal domain-containing protein [Cytophaga aurantiaca]|uniref:glycoside hydrolase family 3 N-terminal domain-containing protein n=1 Tax=Cytophaga aurantiaca TaxID=29530 RepID=UPI0003740877|nr:glycoside hydrolase family 3 N-terminal domain-containing protein [Cytophaga aurantiaca]